MRKRSSFLNFALAGAVASLGMLHRINDAAAFDDASCAKIETKRENAPITMLLNETIDAARMRGIDEVSKLAVFDVIGDDIESSRATEAHATDATATSSYQDSARHAYKALVRVKLIDVSRSGFEGHEQLEVTADISVCVPKAEAALEMDRQKAAQDRQQAEAALERDREKAARDRQPPRVVDPETFAWFDPVTGEAQLWYWVGPNQDYTFFDKGGFDPATGDPLKRVDRQFSKDWRALIAKKRRDAADLVVAQQREAARKEASDAAARQLATRRAEEASRALDACDANAASPNDPRKPATVTGVSWEALKSTAALAIQSCELAARQTPGEPRFKYQLARAYSIGDPKRALPMFKQLSDQHYPAAYDNYGWSLLDRRVGLNDLTGATRAFEAGVRAGDSDAMTSLAGLMVKGSVDPNYPDEPLQLYQRAAKMGNQDAVSGIANLEAEKAQANALRAEQDEQVGQQERTGRMFMGIVGGALANVGRR